MFNVYCAMKGMIDDKDFRCEDYIIYEHYIEFKIDENEKLVIPMCAIAYCEINEMKVSKHDN